MFPNQGTQPGPPVGIQIVPSGRLPVPAGYPTHQLPGNLCTSPQQSSFQRAGFIQGYSQQVVSHPRLIYNGSQPGIPLVPRPDGLPAQFGATQTGVWQSVVIPSSQQPLLQTVNHPVTSRIHNFSGMCGPSQNQVLSTVQSSQNVSISGQSLPNQPLLQQNITGPRGTVIPFSHSSTNSVNSAGTVMFISQAPSNSLPTSSGPPVLIPQVAIMPSSVEQKVAVMWPWKRLSAPEGVVYVSPSGTELKSLNEVKEYLLKEGTCKCGLECPLDVAKTFDFNPQTQSEYVAPSTGPPDPARYCSHRTKIAAMASWEQTSGNKIEHRSLLGSVKSKRPTRKKKPLSGVLTPDVVAARDQERKRINEIILEQRREYEAQMSFKLNTKSRSASTDSSSSTSTSTSTSTPTTLNNVPTKKSETLKPNQVERQPPTALAESHNSSKNLEIRRMSSTEEGDRVLDGAWNSPEKEEKGKTPLDMVQNIISNMEKMEQEQKQNINSQGMAKQNTRKMSPDLPGWVQTPSRPLQHSQTLRPNMNPPTTSVLTLFNRNQGNNMPGLPQGFQPGAVVQPGPGVVQVPAPPSQIMHLVNTSNGPVLIADNAQRQQLVHPQVHHQPKFIAPTQEPPRLLIPQAQGLQPILVSPGGQQLIAVAPQQAASVSHPQQQIILNQPSPVFQGGPMILSNGLMALPASQGVIYNQLPDGTLVPVQQGQPNMIVTSSVPMLMTPADARRVVHQRGPVVLSPNQSDVQGVPVLNPPEVMQATKSQVSPKVSPEGGPMQSKQALTAPTQQPSRILESQSESDEEPLYATDSDEESDDDTDDVTPFVPSTSKKQDKKAVSLQKRMKIIQSNKVDSSGLKATPPHLTEEQDAANESKTSGDLRLSQQDGNVTLDTSGLDSSPVKRPRKRTLVSQLNHNFDSDDEFFDETGSTRSLPSRRFQVGELVWGPHGGFNSWPGKIREEKKKKLKIFWFGSRETSEVLSSQLKSLSEGLESHHRERKKLRKGRRMNPNLEKAIQDAMQELDTEHR